MIVVLREGVAHLVLADDESWPDEPFIRYDGEVRVGWLYDGSRFVEPGSTAAKALEINAQTSRAIDAGVVFRGARISMSLASQVTIIGAFLVRAQIAYPFRWASADDSTVITLESPADVEALFAAATGLVFEARQAGNAAKAQALEEAAK